MDIRFRDAQPADYQTVLDLNDASVHYLSPLDGERLARLASESCQFRVAVRGGKIIGFLMAFADEADYDSMNYRWFATRYRRFVYIDRVVVREDCRGLGLARRFYQELEAWAMQHAMTRLSCEVDVDPPNAASLAFHDKAGFREVGRQVAGDDSKVVSLRTKLMG
ncbi:MAG: hypothetical protein ETSY2_21505 [Candidatus Entotheonella gemina]|uniref:N-acetyltransferase domain-containing protein n=1 Tax=Candidatus Entotheonella gemina TaxID=1429439 RepID=W4M7S0_9BACT|nr:MAG: hypothetical protein ETSY2_21505 [Candidatus Entotheonella gemina]